MVVRSDIVAVNQSLHMSTVTSPPQSTLGNSEELQSSDSRPETVFGPATGFLDDFATGPGIDYELATNFRSVFVPGGFEINFEQAPGFMTNFGSEEFGLSY